MTRKVFSPNAGIQDSDAAISLFYSLAIKRNLRQKAVSISNTTATAIPTTALGSRMTMLIYNNSSDTIYIGDATVTTSDGLPLLPRASLHLDIEEEVAVYGISGGSGSSEIRIIEGS